jgi:hypothetical protein
LMVGPVGGMGSLPAPQVSSPGWPLCLTWQGFLRIARVATISLSSRFSPL